MTAHWRTPGRAAHVRAPAARRGQAAVTRRSNCLAQHGAADSCGAACAIRAGPRQLRYLHLHQLDPLASLRSGVGGEVRRARADGPRVHTPEFGFEPDLDNVRRAMRKKGIGYPLVVDNDFAVWRPSTTTTGPPCTSSTPRVGSGTTTSAKASTRNPRWSSSTARAKRVERPRS